MTLALIQGFMIFFLGHIMFTIQRGIGMIFRGNPFALYRLHILHFVILVFESFIARQVVFLDQSFYNLDEHSLHMRNWCGVYTMQQVKMF